MTNFFLAACYALLLISSGTGCSDNKPHIGQSDTTAAPAKNLPPVPDFDARRAFAYLKAQTDFGPRTANSPGHRNCLSYLEAEMRQYAERVSLQPFTVRGYETEVLKLTNVISSFNPQATRRILLAAHWDTRPRADQEKDPKNQNKPILGANDGASGVAVLLEIARQLKQSPPPVGVDIVFFDGEDYGKEGDTRLYLLGSRYFATHLPAGYLPAFAILLDMVGDAELDLPIEMNSLDQAPNIVDLVWDAASSIGVSQFNQSPNGRITDDHLPLLEAGIPAIDIIDFAYPDTSHRYWHTLEDTPDKCSPQSLEAVGKVLLEVIYRRSE